MNKRIFPFSLILGVLVGAACDSPGNAPTGDALGDPVAPDLRADLRAGDPTGEIEVEVLVDVPSFSRAPTGALELTMVGDLDGDATYTMNGAPVMEADLARRADADRAAIQAHLADTVAARRAAVDAAIASAGLDDVVIDRGHRSFRVRASRDRLARALDVIDGQIVTAMFPPALVETRHASMSAELDAIGVRPFGHAYGHRGQGIGIWQIEGNSPNPEQRPEIADVELLTSDTWERVGAGGKCRSDAECCSNDCVFSLGGNTCAAGCGSCMINVNGSSVCAPGTRNREHATMVAILAHRTAPDAALYHTDGLDPGECMIDTTEVLAQTNPPIYTGTQSWSFEPITDNGTYTIMGTCLRDWDNFIVASRIAHFGASGNAGNSFVGHPGRAFNVMAVGNWDSSTGLVNVGDGSTLSGSGYRNPTYGIEKPEVLAPGTGIVLDRLGWTVNGSSASAPIAAGFSAAMMSGSAFFRNQPQVIRAYLIAGAHNAWGGAGLEGTNGRRDGAGVIDYLDTYFYRAGWAWSSADNDDFFDANQKIVRTAPVTAGKKYTAAIAWLADGDYAYFVASGFGALTWLNPDDDDPTDPLDQKMKLRVQIGSVDVTSAVEKNNFQLVTFTAPVSGTATLTIERTFNAGGGGVDLAMTLGEHE